MDLSEFCLGEIVTIDQSAKVSDAAALMKHRNVGALVVLGDLGLASRPVGILTDRDIATKGVAEGLNLSQTTVSTISSDDLVTVERHLSIETAIGVMVQNKVRRLLIVNENRQPCGFLSATDLFRALSLESARTGRNLAALADLFRLQSGTAASHRSHDFTRMA